MGVVSINAGKTLGSDDLWQALIDGVQAECPEWSVIFIAECDGQLKHMEPPAIDDHTVFRHWPGLGSFPMAVIIRSRLSA